MVRGLRRVELRDLPTLAHAAALIGVVEVLVRLLPLTRTADLLGVPVDVEPRTTSGEVLSLAELPPGARRRLRNATKVANVWPFSHGPCLRRALLGGHMVRALGPVVRLGVIGDGSRMSGHAWLEIDGRPLERLDGLYVFGGRRS